MLFQKSPRNLVVGSKVSTNLTRVVNMAKRPIRNRSPMPKPPSLNIENVPVPDNHVLPMIPVGGRLAFFQGAWKELDLESNLGLILEEGYTIPFRERPPLSSSPPWTKATRQDDPVFREIIQTLLAKRAIEEVVDWTSLGHYSHTFLVPKPNGTRRKIINLKTLNRSVVSHHFRMETAQSVLKTMKTSHWATSIDLKDAYFHIPIKHSSRKFLRFLALNRVWQYRVLCFGLTTAPHVFTRTTEPVSVWARSQGIQIHVYIDDWLILAEDKQSLISHTQKVLQKVQELGWIVNMEKSSLTPSREFTFLGMKCNTAQNSVQPIQKRLDRLSLAVQNLRSEEYTSPRLLQSLIGSMVSTAGLIPYAALERRPLQYLLQEVWDRDLMSLDHKLKVTQSMREAVAWWSIPENLEASVLIQDPRQSVILITDASQVGWGAHLGEKMISGRWSPEESLAFINILEMWAVERALIHFLPLIKHKRVQVLSDNMTVVSYIVKQGGTVSHNMYLAVRKTLLWCKAQGITLEARHIPGKRNVLADRLSRPGLAISTEWKLNTKVFRAVAQQIWLPLVDLFATRWNNQVAQFVSPFPDQLAVGV
jgi:hypothetical protein